jgi:hypothetical protein
MYGRIKIEEVSKFFRPLDFFLAQDSWFIDKWNFLHLKNVRRPRSSLVNNIKFDHDLYI